MRKCIVKVTYLLMSCVFCILLAGALSKREVAAKESDFIIQDGFLVQYLGSDKEVVIPEGVTSIGPQAFMNSTIRKITIPDGVYAIHERAFENCKRLEMIDLPESIDFIGGNCFINCTSLETILFPTREFRIAGGAFDNTLWMMNYEGDFVVINHTLVKYRGKEATVTIPDHITVIGERAFENCTYMSQVNIPTGVKSIEIYAFYGCTSLMEIILPDSVTNIGSYAFANCSNLSNIRLPKDAMISGNALKDTKWLKDYPGDFVIINGHDLLTYKGTDSKVVIPADVYKICYGAFINSSVTRLIIPKNVVKLSYMAFINCKNLERVYFMSNKTELEQLVFDNCSSELKLYGAVGGAVEKYAQTYKVAFSDFGLNKEKATVYLGGDNKVSLKMSGISGAVQWKSEDASIAKVNQSGTVTAVKIGTTQINAIADGIEMSCQITVKKPYLSKTTATIMTGNSTRLNLIGISKDVTWISSKQSVATVNSKGVVTAIKAGTTTIKANYNGKTYSCKVTVKKNNTK